MVLGLKGSPVYEASSGVGTLILGGPRQPAPCFVQSKVVIYKLYIRHCIHVCLYIIESDIYCTYFAIHKHVWILHMYTSLLPFSSVTFLAFKKD